jgi:hypothetical protein
MTIPFLSDSWRLKLSGNPHIDRDGGPSACKPPIASLVSANGPSITKRPLFCETNLPSWNNGFPALALPSAVKRSNHDFIRFTIWSISCGESPVCQAVPRNSNMYSDLVCVHMLPSVEDCFICFVDTQSARAANRFSIHFGVRSRSAFRLRKEAQDVVSLIHKRRRLRSTNPAPSASASRHS